MSPDQASLHRMQRALAERDLSPAARAKIAAYIERLELRIANPEPRQRVSLLAAQLAAEQKIPTGEVLPCTETTWYAELLAAA